MVNCTDIYLVKVSGIKLSLFVLRIRIKDKTIIDLRPDKSLLMLEAGHYEIDTIYGKRSGIFSTHSGRYSNHVYHHYKA